MGKNNKKQVSAALLLTAFALSAGFGKETEAKAETVQSETPAFEEEELGNIWYYGNNITDMMDGSSILIDGVDYYGSEKGVTYLDLSGEKAVRITLLRDWASNLNYQDGYLYYTVSAYRGRGTRLIQVNWDTLERTVIKEWRTQQIKHLYLINDRKFIYSTGDTIFKFDPDTMEEREVWKAAGLEDFVPTDYGYLYSVENGDEYSVYLNHVLVSERCEDFSLVELDRLYVGCTVDGDYDYICMEEIPQYDTGAGDNSDAKIKIYTSQDLGLTIDIDELLELLRTNEGGGEDEGESIQIGEEVIWNEWEYPLYCLNEWELESQTTICLNTDSAENNVVSISAEEGAFYIDGQKYPLSENACSASNVFFVADIDVCDSTVEIFVPEKISGWGTSVIGVYRFGNKELKYLGNLTSTNWGRNLHFDGMNHIYMDDFAVDFPVDGQIVAEFTINENGELELMNPEEGFPYTSVAKYKLQQDLPVYAEKDHSLKPYTIKAQNVFITHTDAGNWVEVEAEDGTGGWMYLEKLLPEEIKEYKTRGWLDWEQELQPVCYASDVGKNTDSLFEETTVVDIFHNSEESLFEEIDGAEADGCEHWLNEREYVTHAGACLDKETAEINAISIDGENGALYIDNQKYLLSENACGDSTSFFLADIDVLDSTVEIFVRERLPKWNTPVIGIYRFKDKTLKYLGNVMGTSWGGEKLHFDGMNHIYVDDFRIYIPNQREIIAEFTINENEELELMNPEEGFFYKYADNEEFQYMLQQDLPVYADRDRSLEPYTIKAQKVSITRTDARNWIEIVGEDGTSGWLYVEKTMPEETKEYATREWLYWHEPRPKCYVPDVGVVTGDIFEGMCENYPAH